jgi:hypothetical protein
MPFIVASIMPESDLPPIPVTFKGCNFATAAAAWLYIALWAEREPDTFPADAEPFMHLTVVWRDKPIEEVHLIEVEPLEADDWCRTDESKLCTDCGVCAQLEHDADPSVCIASNRSFDNVTCSCPDCTS